MFSPIFKEVSSYFDKRALVSAFTPSLVLWTLLVGVGVFTLGSWDKAVIWWKDTAPAKTSSTSADAGAEDRNPADKDKSGRAATPIEQILLVFIFFVAVGFTAFLILNLQPTLVRLYAGYGPNILLLTGILEIKRKRWRKEKVHLDNDFTIFASKKAALTALLDRMASSQRKQAYRQLLEFSIQELGKAEQLSGEEGKTNLTQSDKDSLAKKILDQLKVVKQSLETQQPNQIGKSDFDQLINRINGIQTGQPAEQQPHNDQSEQDYLKAALEKLKLLEEALEKPTDKPSLETIKQSVRDIKNELSREKEAANNKLHSALKARKNGDDFDSFLYKAEWLLTFFPLIPKANHKTSEDGSYLEYERKYYCKRQRASIINLENIGDQIVKNQQLASELGPLTTAARREAFLQRYLSATAYLAKRGWRSVFAPQIEDSPSFDSRSWAKRQQRLFVLTKYFKLRIESELTDLENWRLQLDQQRFFYLPSEVDDIMPTRLGNVLRAAEVYTRDRYKLSASLVWTWLEAVLPKGASTPLYDAKTSLDLMITSSFLILIVGLPISAFSVISVGMSWPWWSLLIPAAFFLLLRFSYLLGVGLIVVSALQGVGKINPLGTWNVLLTLLSGGLLLSGVCYMSAVQAGFSYGERYRVAFDMYRWKILEALHLQLPPDFEEERRMWEVIGLTLFRASIPKEDYWRYVHLESTKEPALPAQVTLKLPVPIEDLRAGDIITQEIANKTIQNRVFSKDDVWADVITSKNDLIGKKPKQTLLAGKPIPLSFINGTQEPEVIAVGIPATSAMLLGGELQKGERIDLILVPKPNKPHQPPDPILFTDLNVLDVKRTGRIPKDDNILPEHSHTVVVALPKERRFEFAAKSLGATFLITQRKKLSTQDNGSKTLV